MTIDDAPTGPPDSDDGGLFRVIPGDRPHVDPNPRTALPPSPRIVDVPLDIRAATIAIRRALPRLLRWRLRGP